MANKIKWVNQHVEVTDGLEGGILTGFPVHWKDEFTGFKLNKVIAGENTVAPWTSVATNVTTGAPLLVANEPSGVVCLELDATDQAERSVLYWGDQLSLNINHGLIFECRLATHVVPTTGTKAAAAIWGVTSADNATWASVASKLAFRCEGDANILWDADDNVTEDFANDTGVDAVADTYHIYRIDCSEPTTPKFYIDGVLVGTAAIAPVISTTGKVQPYFSCQKTTTVSTGVAAIHVDYVRVFQKRAA